MTKNTRKKETMTTENDQQDLEDLLSIADKVSPNSHLLTDATLARLTGKRYIQLYGKEKFRQSLEIHQLYKEYYNRQYRKVKRGERMLSKEFRRTWKSSTAKITKERIVRKSDDILKSIIETDQGFIFISKRGQKALMRLRKKRDARHLPKTWLPAFIKTIPWKKRAGIPLSMKML
jgi:hypothetical protein